MDSGQSGGYILVSSGHGSFELWSETKRTFQIFFEYNWPMELYSVPSFHICESIFVNTGVCTSNCAIEIETHHFFSFCRPVLF